MTDIRRAARWGTWAMCGVLLLVLYRADALHGTGLQRAAYLASIGAWLATASLMGRRRPVLAAVLSGVTLAATTAVTLTVPAGSQHTNANWAIGVNGWLLLTIASGVRLPLLVLWLAVPVATALVAAVPAGHAEIAVMGARALGILGLQVPIALATRVLERSAEAIRELRLTQEAIRTEQVVAAALHDDRLRRSRVVAAAVEPVLADLAATVPDDALRRSSGIAAAQVRRLLVAWNHDGGDPLGDALSAFLDDLQAAGIRVEVAVHADQLPPVLRQAALDVLRACARLPVSRLRLTAVATAERLSLSVVARPGGPVDLGPVPEPVEIRTTVIDHTLWVELTCPL